MRPRDTPELRAAKLAARYAQKMNLPAGNLWEPAVARYLLAQYQQYEQWGFVEAMFCRRVGLEVDA